MDKVQNKASCKYWNFSQSEKHQTVQITLKCRGRHSYKKVEVPDFQKEMQSLFGGGLPMSVSIFCSNIAIWTNVHILAVSFWRRNPYRQIALINLVQMKSHSIFCAPIDADTWHGYCKVQVVNTGARISTAGIYAEYCVIHVRVVGDRRGCM